MQILFEEIQASGKKHHRDRLLVLAGIFLAAFLFNLVLHKGSPGMMGIVFFFLAAALFLASLFIYARLVTQIREDGIYVRYPPFQPRFAVYKWEDILDVYLREYNAFEEYGGWGIRFSMMGKSYLVPGREGLQIILRDKSRILVTTQQYEEMLPWLEKLHRHGSS